MAEAVSLTETGKQTALWPGVVTHACNLTVLEAEAGGSEVSWLCESEACPGYLR